MEARHRLVLLDDRMHVHCLVAALVCVRVFAGVEPPGARLKREGLTAHHPVVLVPGIITGGLELWEGRPCSQGLFRKRLWVGSFADMFKRPMCWLEHLSLDNETGLDPAGIRVRPFPGLVVIISLVWATLIENLAHIGYKDKNMYMAAYDWRLSFHNTELRDQSLSRLKNKIEIMYVMNGYKKVVVVPHSMGVLYFLHFLKWVEAPPPMGGDGGPSWCAKHIKSIVNIGPTILGVAKSVATLLSTESRDVASVRAMGGGVLDWEMLGLQPTEHMLRVSRTWDSIHSLLPKGGDTLWGNLNWSPEEDHVCDPAATTKYERNNSSSRVFQSTKYGIVSFKNKEYDHVWLGSRGSCGRVLTEYDEAASHKEIKRRMAKTQAYTATTILDLLRSIAPKMMKRAEAHFSHGIADNLDDPKYNHYKY